MELVAMQELNTPRLKLRKLTAEDIPAYYARLGSSASVSKYMLWNPHNSLSESEAWVQTILQRYACSTCYYWGIAQQNDNSLIGAITLLRFDEETNSCSFAYMLAEEFWGCGFGTEALSAVLDFGFSQLKLDAIIADHMAENTASGRVMQKAGMHFQAVLPNKHEKNGVCHDAVQYIITRSDWVQQKETQH